MSRTVTSEKKKKKMKGDNDEKSVLDEHGREIKVRVTVLDGTLTHPILIFVIRAFRITCF